MLKLLMILAVGSSWVEAKRYKYVNNWKGMRTLVRSLDNKVYATCSAVFFAEPSNYEDAKAGCKGFHAAVGGGNGSLVTVDSQAKNSHLMFLHDMAYPREEQTEETPDEVKWSWTGLQKVNNNKNKYNKRAMKKKRNVVKNYNAEDWEWMGTGESPKNYAKWPRKKKNSRPDQMWLSKKKGKKRGCTAEEGCFQNWVKVNQDTSNWEDSWEFESHPYACDYQGKYILSNKASTWEQARKACENAGLVLAMVRNEDEVKEMRGAIRYFLGERDEEWKKWDARNWIWLGGDDLEEEGTWVWQNGDPVEKDWDLPWIKWAGRDNSQHIRGTDGQHGLQFNRDGTFDDSFHNHKRKKRAFACQCPES